MDEGLARYTSDYMRSYEKSLDSTKFRKNKKIFAPSSVQKYNSQMGVEVDVVTSAYDREIHAAGIKSPLLKKSVPQGQQQSSWETIDR